MPQVMPLPRRRWLDSDALERQHPLGGQLHARREQLLNPLVLPQRVEEGSVVLSSDRERVHPLPAPLHSPLPLALASGSRLQLASGCSGRVLATSGTRSTCAPCGRVTRFLLTPLLFFERSHHRRQPNCAALRFHVCEHPSLLFGASSPHHRVLELHTRTHELHRGGQLPAQPRPGASRPSCDQSVEPGHQPLHPPHRRLGMDELPRLLAA